VSDGHARRSAARDAQNDNDDLHPARAICTLRVYDEPAVNRLRGGQ